MNFKSDENSNTVWIFSHNRPLQTPVIPMTPSMNASNEGQSDETKPFLEEHEPSGPKRRPTFTRSVVLPWTLVIISWTITAYVFIARKNIQLPQCSPCEPCASCPAPEQSKTDCPLYYPTDLEALQSTVSYEQRHFTGELIYIAESKRIIRNLSADSILYFGPPSDTIDQNWHTLLKGENPVLFPNEAVPFQPDLIPIRTDNQFHFEPDVFHSLHCLNAIRMVLDKDYYGEEGKALHQHASVWPQEDFERIHQDHCMDQIRQALMCNGDLSPVPLYSWPGVPVAVGRGSEHTCRKWEPIREWVNARNKDYAPIEEW